MKYLKYNPSPESDLKCRSPLLRTRLRTLLEARLCARALRVSFPRADPEVDQDPKANYFGVVSKESEAEDPA